MSRFVLSLLIIGATAGCTDNKKIPEGIISIPKMEKVMWDMVQADRFVNTYMAPVTDSTGKQKKQVFQFYERVFNLHDISRDEFLRSYKFYLSRPDLTKTMFDSITVRAERKRADTYKSKAPNARDSILKHRDSLIRNKPVKR